MLLRDWIRRDGLKCLKVKLRGDDSDWDYDRLLKVGRIAVEEGVDWLTADFNCTVNEPAYVNAILDRLIAEHPRLYGMLLYVEQPFPYDLEAHRIDVHSVSARKPLFMDESAHDWRFVRLGRELGWSGVALKTCKTQTGALLSLCWAKAHGMTLMVQDLSNPMLAQVSHVLLAAHAGTIMGVESQRDAVLPRGLAPRGDGPSRPLPPPGRPARPVLDPWPGFGYRVDEIERTLPCARVFRGALTSREISSASLQVTRAGWVGYEVPVKASEPPGRGEALRSGGVALRASTPAIPELIPAFDTIPRFSRFRWPAGALRDECRTAPRADRAQSPFRGKKLSFASAHYRDWSYE